MRTAAEGRWVLAIGGVLLASAGGGCGALGWWLAAMGLWACAFVAVLCAVSLSEAVGITDTLQLVDDSFRRGGPGEPGR